MGLVSVRTIAVVAVAGMIAISGCSHLRLEKSGSPADPVSGKTFRYDCCNPGLDAEAKFLCKLAVRHYLHAFRDLDENVYRFIWSDCKVGEEPWRKYE